MNQSCPQYKKKKKSPVIKFLCKGAYEVQHINYTPLGSVHKEKKKSYKQVSRSFSLSNSRTQKRK